MTASHDLQANEVLAKLCYHLKREDGGADEFVFLSPEARKFNSIEVRIKNIRGQESDFTLDEHGFQLLQGVRQIKSSNSEYLEAEHSAEIVRTIMANTGASEVLVTHINIRLPRPDTGLPRYLRGVHVDKSFGGARSVYLEKYPQFTERFERSRWALVNWWQPIYTPATRMPMAVCDARSVADDDWREVIGRSPAESEKKTCFGMWRIVQPQNPGAHKWYFFQDIQLDEALLFKIYDSKEHGVSRRTPHAAFESPTDHGPTRTSIEYRTLLFWDE